MSKEFTPLPFTHRAQNKSPIGTYLATSIAIEEGLVVLGDEDNDTVAVIYLGPGECVYRADVYKA